MRDHPAMLAPRCCAQEALLLAAFALFGGCVAGCGAPMPPPSAPRTPMLGVCGLTQQDTPRCPGFAGDGGGSLHGSLTFSTLLFTRLRSCGLAVQQTSMAWAKTHALPVIHVDSGPKRLYLLAWSSAREGWFEIRYKHDWLPPRAYVDVNFVDLSLRQLEPAMIPGFDAEFDLDTLLANLSQNLRCTAE